MSTGAVVVAIIVILIGIVGIFIPYIPGIPLIFIAILAYGWYEGFHQISAYYIALMAALTVLALVVDYLSATLGAKHFGSSKYGIRAHAGDLAGDHYFCANRDFCGAIPGSSGRGNAVRQGHGYSRKDFAGNNCRVVYRNCL